MGLSRPWWNCLEAALWCRTLLDDSFVRLQAGHSNSWTPPSQRTWCFNHQKEQTTQLYPQTCPPRPGRKAPLLMKSVAGSALLGLLSGPLTSVPPGLPETGRATGGCGPEELQSLPQVPGVSPSSRDKPKPCATLLSPCLTPDEETVLFKGWSASGKDSEMCSSSQ